MITAWYAKKVKKPKAGTSDEWAKWTEATKKNHAILYFLFDTLPIIISVRKKRFGDFFYHVKQKYSGKGFHILKLNVRRFCEPYNVERLHNYSWIDVDSQIELFMFQILVNFIEKEVGLQEFIDITYDEERNHTSDVYKELLEIYYWFLDDYCDDSYEKQLRSELYLEYPDHKSMNAIDLFATPKDQRERDYQKSTTEMFDKIRINDTKKSVQMTGHLITLVKLRKYMWT